MYYYDDDDDDVDDNDGTIDDYRFISRRVKVPTKITSRIRCKSLCQPSQASQHRKETNSIVKHRMCK